MSAILLISSFSKDLAGLFPTALSYYAGCAREPVSFHLPLRLLMVLVTCHTLSLVIKNRRGFKNKVMLKSMETTVPAPI